MERKVKKIGLKCVMPACVAYLLCSSWWGKLEINDI
jgi:hypothetical protein